MKKKDAKKAKEAKSDLLNSRNIVGLVVVLAILVVGYFIIWGGSSEVGKAGESMISPKADALSEGAFDYINEYRAENGLDALDFSYSVYLVALDMSNRKDEDKLLFRQAPERNQFIADSIDLSDFPVQYNTIYEIDGSGIGGFEDEFDRVYFIQNILKTDKYDSGAIGCNLNYCSLILLSKEGEIETMQDY